MPRAEEDVINDADLLDFAVEWAESNLFRTQVDAFRNKYAYLFEAHLKLSEDSKSGDLPEQSHELYEAFTEYKDLIEALFEEFCTHHKVSMKIFYEAFHAVAEGQCTALFEEHRHQWFVDMIISWTEYEEFVTRMCDEVKRQRPGRPGK